jgi:son of sevenless-like protein
MNPIPRMYSEFPTRGTPQDLAIALAMLEGDKYTEILPCDYIYHIQCSEGNENINAALNANDKIVYWVQHDVLRHDDLKTRRDVLNFFVYTAEVVFN